VAAFVVEEDWLMMIPPAIYGAARMFPTGGPLLGKLFTFIAPVLLTKMLFRFIPEGPIALETLGAPPVL